MTLIEQIEADNEQDAEYESLYVESDIIHHFAVVSFHPPVKEEEYVKEATDEKP